jgi:hypothetical protein
MAISVLDHIKEIPDHRVAGMVTLKRTPEREPLAS